MSNFHEDNVALMTLKLKEFAEREAKREVLKRMRRIAQKMVDFIDGNFSKNSQQFPQFTANLHDATGIAIYDDGGLDRYLPTQRATAAQMSPIGEDEWGREELENAIKQGLTKYSKGLWLVMFSASSYAEDIEDMGSPKGRGKGFFTWFWESMSIDIKKEFKDCIVKPMIGLADSIPF